MGLNSMEIHCKICSVSGAYLVCHKRKSKDGGDLRTCSRCHRAKYCSRECQRVDWKVHSGNHLMGYGRKHISWRTVSRVDKFVKAHHGQRLFSEPDEEITNEASASYSYPSSIF